MDKSNILIISQENDGTTDRVIKWIKKYKGNYVRLNDTSILKFKSLYITNDDDDVIFEYNGNPLKLSDFNSYWYRRGRLNVKFPEVTISSSNALLERSFQESMRNEKDFLINYIYNYFEKKHSRCIGSIFNNNTNKIYNLVKAKDVGLSIPETHIVSKKKDLIYLIKKFDKALVKPIHQRGFHYEDQNIKTSGLSALISKKDIQGIANDFFPSLVQCYVEKWVELRIFYLNGLCYTSAIFSQLDEKTKIDFRNYNWEKPNRTPPFTLPNEIECKIVNFMQSVNMVSGSLDMILSPKGEYVFLEVNPIGQFWQVSYPCNFNLEKIIAKYLCYK